MIDTKKVRPGEVLVLTVPEGVPGWQAQDLLRSVRARLDAVPGHMVLPDIEWHAVEQPEN